MQGKEEEGEGSGCLTVQLRKNQQLNATNVFFSKGVWSRMEPVKLNLEGNYTGYGVRKWARHDGRMGRMGRGASVVPFYEEKGVWVPDWFIREATQRIRQVERINIEAMEQRAIWKAEKAVLQNELKALVATKGKKKRKRQGKTESQEEEDKKAKTETQVVWEYDMHLMGVYYYGIGATAWSKFESESSIIVEQMYQEYQQQKLESTACSTIRSHSETYLVNFEKMTQQNVRTGSVRNIQRRTVHPAFEHQVPSCFDSMLPYAKNQLATELSILPSCTDEYKTIEEHFYKTMSNKTFIITRIERNVQPATADMFLVALKHAKNKSQRMLWHGFGGSNVGNILSQGLDVKRSRGGTLGHGIYLAEDANYSHQSYTTHGYYYSAEETQLLYVRALLGTCYEYRAPSLWHQPNMEQCPIGYDSATTLSNTSNIYAVYDNSHLYVAFRVFYKTIPV